MGWGVQHSCAARLRRFMLLIPHNSCLLTGYLALAGSDPVSIVVERIRVSSRPEFRGVISFQILLKQGPSCWRTLSEMLPDASLAAFWSSSESVKRTFKRLLWLKTVN